ncbi:ribosomal_S10 domain-containing protein [Haematococcus lacustris]|uniref:Ribosomal_S10 domain-containing protein n=1 Tax=Haematococcus lacustris TaxID=44745 RepID=A0A699ZEA0_HAELA|nr:ribosomal_S10 domain-containing protein [Haematococcus lacustris]
MFINFAPKSSQLLPEQPRTTKPLPLNIFMPLEQQEPAQEWMPAMLRAGQVAAALEAAAQERSLTQAYASFALFAHALLFALFKQWVQAGAAEVSPHLALPSQQEMQSWGSQGRG